MMVSDVGRTTRGSSSSFPPPWVTTAQHATVLKVAHELRDREIRVEYALGDMKVNKQLELAAARRARFAVVIGPDEGSRGAAVLKDLDARSQTEVSFHSLSNVLVEALQHGR